MKILDADKEKVARVLKKYGIEIPVRLTTKKILKELKSVGIVISRSDIIGKSGRLYALNPFLELSKFYSNFSQRPN